jgi:hypothetical protein
MPNCDNNSPCIHQAVMTLGDQITRLKFHQVTMKKGDFSTRPLRDWGSPGTGPQGHGAMIQTYHQENDPLVNWTIGTIATLNNHPQENKLLIHLCFVINHHDTTPSFTIRNNTYFLKDLKVSLVKLEHAKDSDSAKFWWNQFRLQ